MKVLKMFVVNYIHSVMYRTLTITRLLFYNLKATIMYTVNDK